MEKPSFRSVSRLTVVSPQIVAGQQIADSKKDKSPMRVQPENVVRQGILFQRTSLLKRFRVAYMFYLEKRDELTGLGPFLKYGKRGKNIHHVLDLWYRPVEQTEG